MDEGKGHTQELFENHHQNKLKQLKATNHEIISSHLGELSKEDVNDIGYEIETALRNSGIKKGVVKRVFSIIVEALQNIRLHGEKSENGIQCTSVVVGESKGTYTISTANLILQDNIEQVESKIEHINGLDLVALKQHYMEVLTNGEISHKGGAGLGFITIAMKSKQKLDFEFTTLNNDVSMFCVDSYVEPKEK